ncbi:hypothetical protein SESBI_14274 [Sesbania bispinosa]|nr:hypothetical protein SESBI_14274 [Sesbania bispinosa]
MSRHCIQLPHLPPLLLLQAHAPAHLSSMPHLLREASPSTSNLDICVKAHTAVHIGNRAPFSSFPPTPY